MPRPADTSADVYAAQLAMFRAMTPAERSAMAVDLSETVIAATEDGIRRRHPEYSEDEVLLTALRLRIGNDLFSEAYPEAPLLPA